MVNNPPRKSLTGLVFERLTVVDFSHYDNRRKSHWDCRCACGALKKFRGDHLLDGKTKSCGCLQKDLLKTHGLSKTPIRRTWNNMIQRCSNPNATGYSDYGGRGVTVCDRWTVFENFYADMGNPPSSNHSLERQDNNRPYEPGNVKWATRIEQGRNTRRNKLLTINGITQCISAWAHEKGLKPHVVASRVKMGWPSERLFEPVKTKKDYSTRHSSAVSSP